MPDKTKEQQSDSSPLHSQPVSQGGHFGFSHFMPGYLGDSFGNTAKNPSHVEVTLDLSAEVAQSLGRLMREANENPSDFFRKAIGLYTLAKEAKREGKAVGIATTPDSLETEFVGL